jgi:predicted ester cyclase
VFDEVMDERFVDHHPGLVDVASLEVYKRNLAFGIEALEMKAEPAEVIAAGDKVFTRSKLTGRHVGMFFGIPPTGNQLTWYTNERWRVEQGKMKERWAVDDLVSLFSQMGVPMPTWQ